MKVAPTLEGGLRIDTEDLGDWEILHAILHDAQRGGSDLANDLGGLIGKDAGAEDWQEYVVPDLRSEFQGQLDLVATAIGTAMRSAEGGPGSVWIKPAEGFIWYGALNQARLAIEETHHFGPGEGIDPDQLPPARRSAYIRSRFYLIIQSMLLDHVLD